MTIHRITAHRMGAWRWGYPRGQRQAVTSYSPGYTRDGRLVWRSSGNICNGLTASNESYFASAAPDAFRATYGSVHNRPACLSIYAGVPVVEAALVG